jgi:hypothetical protein
MNNNSDEISIYDLNLHEGIYNETAAVIITRVPGGWLYENIDESEIGTFKIIAVTFVPYNEEFKND